MDLRYEITPQMRAYDRMSFEWHPYLLFLSSPNYVSKEVNTDAYGLRLTRYMECDYSMAEFKKNHPASILVGGSSAFGVGSTSDKHTIPSILSRKLGHVVFNFGGRAFNSTQELILFSRFAEDLNDVKNVFLFSGANDLYLSGFNEKLFAPFFFSSKFHEVMDNMVLSSKRQILKKVFQPWMGSEVDWKKIGLKELFVLLVKNANPSENVPDENSPGVRLENSLRQIRKDLYVWKKLSESMRFKLIYALQPMFSWCGKKPNQKESMLLNNSGDTATERILRSMESQAIYSNYSQGIKRLCKDLQVDFIDVNSTFGIGDDWLFVDRVHLTDLGNERVASIFSEYLESTAGRSPSKP